MSDKREAALRYAGFGWRIIPCYWITDEGVCACKDGPSCSAAGKHPRTFGGSRDATNDVGQVERWWGEWPDANIALVCGPESGVFVIDIDPRHGGYDSIEEWELNRDDGPLPQTLTSQTGGGGRHLIFQWPDDGPVPGRNPWLPGVDVKGEGGYVILPPSNHASGDRYHWLLKPSPEQPPADLLSSIRGGGGRSTRPALPSAEDILKGVPEGQRDEVLFRHACQLRRKGFLRGQVEAIILHAAANCLPPFPEELALRKVEQAWRYASDEDWTPIGADPEGDRRHLTDDGNAHRLVDLYHHELRYVGAWGWLVWDGQRWQRDELDVITQKARDVVQTIYAEAEDEDDNIKKKAITGWAFKSESASRIGSMIQLARSDPAVSRHSEIFDADPWLINTPQGVLDLRTGEVRPPTKDDHMTKITRASFDTNARCTRWMAFLERIIPDEEVREFIRRAVGYSLTGITREKVMFLLHGTGDNGKTVFLETIRDLFGDYGANTPSAMLVNRKPDAIPNDVARLRGARFATASETEEGARMASSFIKEITGGDTITARFMRQDFFEFTPEFKLWFATNHPPVVHDFGDAIWKRIRMVPFTVAIPKVEQIPRDVLENDLRAEADGIFTWAVGGCLAWQTDGLSEPSAVLLATESYREDMDWFREFIDDCCTLDPHAFTLSQDLYNTYKTWAIMRGDLKPMNLSAFGRQMTSRNLQALRGRGGRGFRGVRMKTQSDHPTV